MSNTSLFRTAALFRAALLCVLSACGGGGGDTGATAPAAPAPVPPPAAPAFAYIHEVDVIRVCRVEDADLSNCVEADTNAGMNLTPTLGMAVNGDHAYLAINDDPFSSALVRCSIGADSTLFGCAPTALDPVDGRLSWVTFRESMLYVGGSDSPRVRKCAVNADGSLEPCVGAGVPDSAADAVGDLQFAGTSAYLLLRNAEPDEDFVVRCEIGADGSLSDCADADVPGLAGPSNFTVHGNHLYVANTDANRVIHCVIADGGSLSGCADSGARALEKPTDLAIRGSAAFIANNGITGGVTRCTVTSYGLLSDCAPIPETGTNLYGIVFR